MVSEFASRAYEIVPGEKIHRAFRGQRLPAPPAWVREQVVQSDTLKYQSWAKELPPGWPSSEARETCVEYIRDWPRNLAYGRNLVLASRLGSYRKAACAAATMNEILFRYSHQQHLTTLFFPLQLSAERLLRQRQSGDALYGEFYRQATHAKLLVLDGLLDVAAYPELRPVVASIVQSRIYDRLPMILTVNADISQDDWRACRPVLNVQLRELLFENAHFFVSLAAETEAGFDAPSVALECA